MIEKAIIDNQVKGGTVISWTGGKDGCLAGYKAILNGSIISYLLNFRDVKKQGSHDINPGLLYAQSESLGIPLICRDFISYEQEFKEVILSLRVSGVDIQSAIFGHITTHKRLVERICEDLGIELSLPIWREKPGNILRELISTGFEAILISVKADLLDESWLGRKIDDSFIKDLAELDRSIDLCGENGEFHTLVTDGPIFKRKLKIIECQNTLRGGHWHLDVLRFTSEEK